MCARFLNENFPKHINLIPNYFPRGKELFSYKIMTKITLNVFLDFLPKKMSLLAMASTCPQNSLSDVQPEIAHSSRTEVVR